ncbi:hypothetical protein K438DRAFT_1482370, partial [Mycena galopus ATCC 62051]
MTGSRKRLFNTRPHRVPIAVANGVVIFSELIGWTLLRPCIHGRRHSRHIVLTNVLYVPRLSHNLISVTYLSRVHGYSILTEGSTVRFTRNGELLFEADIDERNQSFVREDDGKPDSDSALSAVGTLPLDLALLHWETKLNTVSKIPRSTRMGHHSDTQKILSKDLVTGVTISSNQKPDPICEPCLAGKLNAGPFPSTQHRAAAPLDLIHSD